MILFNVLGKTSLIKMYFDKTATSGLSFTQFIDKGLSGTLLGCSSVSIGDILQSKDSNFYLF